jgi:hypothetical protein
MVTPTVAPIALSNPRPRTIATPNDPIALPPIQAIATRVTLRRHDPLVGAEGPLLSSCSLSASERIGAWPWRQVRSCSPSTDCRHSSPASTNVPIQGTFPGHCSIRQQAAAGLGVGYGTALAGALLLRFRVGRNAGVEQHAWFGSDRPRIVPGLKHEHIAGTDRGL